MTSKVKILVAFSFGMMVFSVFSRLFIPWSAVAIGAGTDLIYGCESDLTGLLRIASSTNCSVGETSITWRQGPEVGTEFPLICGNCSLDGIDLQGRDLSSAWLKSAYIVDSNFSHTTMTNAVFTGATLTASNFSSSNLINASLEAAQADSVDFTSSTLTGVNLTNTNLTDSFGLTASSLDGAAYWSTICPDATNSDDNEGTCVGHLTP
ncbi:MAG: pentapeptide repeat-containing protein [Patescibacteria group bacterium]|jgi:uncharacterized protein YjbI with pentapeptide repeats